MNAIQHLEDRLAKKKATQAGMKKGGYLWRTLQKQIDEIETEIQDRGQCSNSFHTVCGECSENCTGNHPTKLQNIGPKQ